MAAALPCCTTSRNDADGRPYTAAVADFPDIAAFDSLLDVLDDAATRWPAVPPMWSLRTDEGLELPWSAAEMQRRSRLAAWRLRRHGLQPGDRLLTWSPSTPRLPAVYWGAMRAGVIVVPLDLRMTRGVIERISARAETRWSLSALTLPHMLVRLVVAEQLYRAASLLANHPYHRA